MTAIPSGEEGAGRLEEMGNKPFRHLYSLCLVSMERGSSEACFKCLVLGRRIFGRNV